MDWLHHVITRFAVYKKDKQVGMIDIENEKVRTQDERLKEIFYLLLDEGYEGQEIKPDADGSALVQQALEVEGYTTQEAGGEAEDALTKKTKSEVSYENPAKGNDRCRDCRHFDSTAKNCAIVSGDIAPTGWCKEFSRVVLFDYQGLKIHAEQLRGDTRHGETFHQRMTVPYGYIKSTEGADGDAVDVFLGPLSNAQYVYVIHTRNRSGSYDEDKVMLGFENALSAQQTFLENYDNPYFFESMEKFDISEFKGKLRTLRGKKITS